MNIYYAKSILYAYPCIERLIEQIDETVEKRALASMNDCSPCFNQCEKIVELTNRKILLIKLKGYVETAIADFTAEELDCLDYKYFRKKPKSFYKDFDFTSRAYFRKQNKIVNCFAKKLLRQKLNDENYQRDYLKMDFFKELLKKVIEHEINNNKNTKRAGAKVVSKDFSLKKTA